jgi:hypothetical protein
MDGLFDLTKVFGDVLGDTPNSLLAKGIRLAEVEPGRMADVLQPTQANTLRRAAGGLFGVDTSNERERLKAALGQLDLQDPAQAAKAVELIRAVDPAAAGTLQNALIEQQRQTKVANSDALRANASMLQAKVAESSLPIDQQRANTADIMADIAAEQQSLAERTQDDLTGWRASQLENQIRELEIREEENRVRESIARTTAGDLDSRSTAAVREATEAGRVLRGKAASALSIANGFTSIENIPSGAPALIKERWKSLLGNEDEVTLLRANYNAVKNSLVMDNLPPGVASDKDIELALSGFLPATANPEQISSFMRGMAKISDISSKKEFMRAIHLTENKGLDSKFQEEWEAYLETDEFKDYLNKRGHSIDTEKSTSTLGAPVSNTSSLADDIAAERARRAAQTNGPARRL